MPRKRCTPEEIIGKLREAAGLLSQGQSVGQAARALAISEQSYYRPAQIAGPAAGARSTAVSRQGTGTLSRTEQAQRVKALEQESSRLKRLVADLSRDNAMLRETISGN